MAPATLRDVAYAAGVAVSTASRALNNSGYVGENTRQRVLQAARELSYVPNSMARGLHSGQTRTVGVIVTTILDPFYAAVVTGIQQVLGARGYCTVLYNSEENQRKELAAVKALLQQRVDGIILAPAQNTAKTARFLAIHSVPFVLVGHRVPDLDADYVVCDEAAVGQVRSVVQMGAVAAEILLSRLLRGNKRTTSPPENLDAGFLDAISSCSGNEQ